MRIRRFNKKYPNGFLFTDPEEFRKAEESGEWVDSYLKVYDEETYKKPPVQGVVEPPLETTAWNESQEIAHQDEVPEPPQPETTAQKFCECGCGTPVVKRFVKGHHLNVRKQNGDSSDDKPPDPGDSL